MEISVLQKAEREALLDLLDLWKLPDGWSGRDFFRRSFEADPTYLDSNVWVARDQEKLVACVQIFPRRIQLLGHAVPVGGIGSVFTHPDQRCRGVASELIGRASTAMQAAGMELSLLFSDLDDFYSSWGWKSQTVQRSLVRRAKGSPPVVDSGSGGEIKVTPFESARDYVQVKSLHSAYSASRNGTVIRDAALWDASLTLAGNPQEEFLVALRDGIAVAYVRAARISDTLCVTELGHSDDAPGAQARLIESLLQPRDPDPLAPPEGSSDELRSALVLPTFDDLALTVDLEHRGVKLQAIEDTHTMLRCLDLAALAERLGVNLLPKEDGAAFLDRILPPDSLAFWPADRF